LSVQQCHEIDRLGELAVAFGHRFQWLFEDGGGGFPVQVQKTAAGRILHFVANGGSPVGHP
jgi:hypothetical protein